MTTDPRMLAFLAENKWGVLATIKSDGRPQLSNVGYFFDPETQLIRVSVTADRAKTRNLAADPRVTLHVASKDFWTWVAVEGTAGSSSGSGPSTPTASSAADATGRPTGSGRRAPPAPAGPLSSGRGLS